MSEGHFYVVVTKTGALLGTEAGSPYLFPTAREASRWMVRTDKRIEPWFGGFKPLPKEVQGEC